MTAAPSPAPAPGPVPRPPRLHDVSAGAPAVEERRQRALDSLQLSEDRQQKRFERITRLTRTALGVPQAAITVLDRDRAWWPSTCGFTDPPRALPREQTFCDTTAAVDELLVVPDARLDPRFRDLDGVRAGHWAFYAGRPLRDAAGHVLGTLCVFAPEPRTLAAEQAEMFEDLAAWAEQELTSSREMAQARKVQSALLPSAPLEFAGWQVAGLCQPALAVGGDFYDYTLAHHALHVMVGDVMGKGTGAALVGAGVRAAVRATTREVMAGADLGRATTDVARGLQDDLDRAESFVTLGQVLLDLDSGEARWVDAGSGLGLLVRADGDVVRLAGRDRPMGILPDDTWAEHRLVLGPSDRLVLLSDGLLDLVDDPLRWWEPLEALVRAADDVADLLASVHVLTRRRPPLDDVTVVGVFGPPRSSWGPW